MSEALIQMDNIKKVFLTEEVETHALSDVSFGIAPGEFVSIAGPSGSGKTTLLSILGLLDTASDGTFKVPRHAVLLGERGKARAVMGKQRFVRGDHVLAGAKRRFDRLLGDAGLPTDQLDEDIDFRIGGKRDRVFHEAYPGEIDIAFFTPVARGHGDDFDLTTGARRQRLTARLNEPQEAAADNAYTGQSKLQFISHGKIRTSGSPWRQWE